MRPGALLLLVHPPAAGGGQGSHTDVRVMENNMESEAAGEDLPKRAVVGAVRVK